MKTLSAFRSSALLLTAILVMAPAFAQTSTWKIDPAHSGVDFKIRHLAVSNVRGTLGIKGGMVHLDDKDISHSSVDAVMDAASVNTNEPPRDTHLKSPDFFNVAQFPTLTFKSTSVYKADGKLMLKGDLTLAGVTKSVTLTLDGPAPPQTDPKGTTRSGFSANGTLSRKDFNFGSKYGAPTLGDEVEFTIDIEMDKQ